MLSMKVADTLLRIVCFFEREKRHVINLIKIKSLLCSPQGRRKDCLSYVKRVIVEREERDVNSEGKDDRRRRCSALFRQTIT